MAAEHDAEAQADRTRMTPEQFYQRIEARQALLDIWRESDKQADRTRRRAARRAVVKWVLVWCVTAMPLSFAVGYGLHSLGPDAQAFSGVLGLIIGGSIGLVCLDRYDREGRW